MERNSLKMNQRIDSETLFRVMERVGKNWSNFVVRSLGDPVDGIAPLPLERLVQWNSPERVTVVIRTASDFGDFFAQVVLEGESNGISGDDAFNELVNIYCGHLITALRNLYGPFPGPFLPESSIPAKWPPREPDAACALLVEDTPLEIRLWLGV